MFKLHSSGYFFSFRSRAGKAGRAFSDTFQKTSSLQLEQVREFELGEAQNMHKHHFTHELALLHHKPTAECVCNCALFLLSLPLEDHHGLLYHHLELLCLNMHPTSSLFKAQPELDWRVQQTIKPRARSAGVLLSRRWKMKNKNCLIFQAH